MHSHANSHKCTHKRMCTTTWSLLTEATGAAGPSYGSQQPASQVFRYVQPGKDFVVCGYPRKLYSSSDKLSSCFLRVQALKSSTGLVMKIYIITEAPCGSVEKTKVETNRSEARGSLIHQAMV